jgi:hypothetical protein
MSTKTRNKVRRIKTTDTLLETTCDLVNKRYICPLGPLACALYVRKKKKDYSWAHLADTQRTRYAWYEKLACAFFFSVQYVSYKTAAILSSWSMTMMLFMAAVNISAYKLLSK